MPFFVIVNTVKDLFRGGIMKYSPEEILEYVKDEDVACKFLPGKIPSFVKEDFAEK